MTEKAIQQPISIAARLNYLFYILVLGALVFFIIWFGGGALLTNLSKLSNGSIYISVSSWDVPLIVGLPCFFALGYVLVLRLLNIASEQRVQQSLRIGVSFALAAIVVRLLYGFTVAGFLSHKGYSSCWQYSSLQVMSPTVWVKSPDFCIANSGSVRKEVLSWMDTLPNAGKDIRSQDVENKVAELLRQPDTEGY